MRRLTSLQPIVSAAHRRLVGPVVSRRWRHGVQKRLPASAAAFGYQECHVIFLADPSVR